MTLSHRLKVGVSKMEVKRDMETWNKQGFKSNTEYLEHLAKRKGFKSLAEYYEHLAKRKGFKSNTEYLEHLAKQKGFKSLAEYREHLKNIKQTKEAILQANERGDDESLFSDPEFLENMGLSCSKKPKYKEVADSSHP